MVSLTNIVNELNPLKDMEPINFNQEHRFRLDADPVEAVKQEVKNMAYFLSGLVKPIGRGMLVGGSIGAFMSYASGGSISEGWTRGAPIGFSFDIAQYNSRLMYNYFKSYFKAKNKCD